MSLLYIVLMTILLCGAPSVHKVMRRVWDVPNTDCQWLCKPRVRCLLELKNTANFDVNNCCLIGFIFICLDICSDIIYRFYFNRTVWHVNVYSSSNILRACILYACIPTYPYTHVYALVRFKFRKSQSFHSILVES